MIRALVTGTSRGIGRATCLELGGRGAELVLLGRTSEDQRETEELLLQRGIKFTALNCDFRDRAGVDAALLAVERSGPPMDILVHNAGFIERSFIHEMSDCLWDDHLEVNLTAPLRITRALLPAMIARKSGRVLFVSSISAGLGTSSQAAYNTSKAGLVALMKCLAEELSGTGVSTMALLPGAVDTDMLAGSAFAPRMSPEEVARTLGFYALDAASAHNGGSIEMFGI